MNLSKSEKTFAIFGTVFICVIGLAIITFTQVQGCQLRQELLEKYGEKAIEDDETGNILCGLNAKKRLDEEIITFRMCGETVRLKRSIAEKVQKANVAMEADYAENKGDVKPKNRWKHKCIKVSSSFRTNMHQKRIYDHYLEKDEDGNVVLDKKGKPKQASPAALPCHSFHETGQAIDVSNWYQAQPYLEAQGFVGGTRGKYKDPWHFSIGEMTRKGAAFATKQMAWWGICKKTSLCKKRKY